MPVSCEWGLKGIQHLIGAADAFIVIDVLSFSTCIDVACGRGAIVFPSLMRADDAEAEAKRRRATLAVPRRLAKPGELCLSPASLKSVPGDLRLVLPSPNGSTLSLSTGDRPTLAGCLRNARAVAAFARRFGDNVAVIPAGERWRDGSLRPAIEDWLGAGAIVDALDLPLSAEAALARDSFRASRPRIRQLLNDSLSGQELIESGWSDDVAIAAEVDVSPNVAQLLQGGYRAVAP